MNKVKKVKLEDITTNLDKLRIPLSSSERSKLDKIYPYYGAQSIVDYVDRFLFDGEYLLVAEDGENLKSQNSNVCNYVTGKFWVNNHAHILQSKDDNSLKYIYYLLNLRDFRPYVTGSAQPKLTQDNLNKMELLIHEPCVQQKIASVLSALDSKIELNNRINAELEAMAKTLYDYWFVQFDFPDRNGKPYQTGGGKMVWNEELKREIPEGWEVQKMAEWLDIDKSGDWGKEEAEGNFTKQVICFRGADINGLNGLDELKPPVRWILEKNSFKILKSHDLIIEISGGSPTQSTGRLAFITDATIKRFKHPLICSNFCKPVSMRNKKLLYNFVYYWNSLYDNGIFFGYEGKTSGIKNLLLDSFISSYYTVVPDEKIVDQFYDIMDNIQEKKQTALAENQKLTELRDWLLPMLMNGQLKLN
jgi:type I restriction enzyme S subunit